MHFIRSRIAARAGIASKGQNSFQNSSRISAGPRPKRALGPKPCLSIWILRAYGAHLGPILDIDNFGAHFGDFGAPLGPILDPIWVPFWGPCFACIPHKQLPREIEARAPTRARASKVKKLVLPLRVFSEVCVLQCLEIHLGLVGALAFHFLKI